MILGQELMIAGFAVEGVIREDEAKTLLQELIHLIEMTPVGEPYICHFPTPQGQGGVGETLAQAFTAANPLIFQSLAESFAYILPGVVAVDTWPEHRQTNGGAYIVVASCKRFQPQTIINYLGQNAYSVLNHNMIVLTL